MLLTRRWLAALPALALASLPPVSEAYPITYQFAGKVYAIADEGHQLDGIVALGDPYTATFVFDTTSPDIVPADPSLGRYTGPSAALTMPNIDAHATSNLEVRDSTLDWLDFEAVAPAWWWVVRFQDQTGTTLSSDAMPTQIPDFPQLFLAVFWNPGPAKFSASVDSILIIPEPEPGVLVLVLVGLVAAVGLRR